MSKFSFPRNIRLYLFGVMLAVITLNFTNCPEKVSGPSNENPTGVETPALKSFSKTAENFFLEGKRDSIIANTYPEFSVVAQDYLPNDPAILKKFGEALTKKKLLYAGELYAEYEITIDGKRYTVAFGQSGDGVWKIVRF
ncbi:MAG: hypothetical protein CH6_1897 [Candidatus Kapaibacterium sp.]|nr:MAG: hypothetical protein CH6_1897 [Candidatus Kapabacteria bacterium]